MTNFIQTIEIEFPSIQKDGKFYTLDLSKIVKGETYTKVFIKSELAYALVNNMPKSIEYLSFPELWIIQNNPKYDYLYKE